MTTIPALPAHKPATGVLPTFGGWCSSARLDPITELVAFPDFDSMFPDHLAASVNRGCSVGLAIGDVDHLKEYVENANDCDPMSFGHLAGNAFMRDLGQLSAGWFHQQNFARGCLSTFGGDEVILAAEVASAGLFHTQVVELAAVLSANLPRTVSFAVAVLDADTTGSVLHEPQYRRRLYVHLVAAVDRRLFAVKSARDPDNREQFITTAYLPPFPEGGLK